VPTRVSLVVVPLLTNDIVPSPPFASQMPPPPRGEANPAYPLAGTQTALPSVPAPTRVSLVVVPLPTNDIVPSPPFASQMPPPPRGEANPRPRLAGTQTALTSVPAPTRVSLVVVPLLTNDIVPSPPFASQMPPPPRGEANSASPSCRHSDGFAVGARTHEGEFRG